jgi:thiol-disulfide isomerase/thioredoxin
MKISNDVFEQGESYAQYRDRILAEEGTMRDLLVASEAKLAETEIDISPFLHLSRPYRLLVLSEDWCGDCTDNLPILNRIAAETGKIEVRIVSRDANQDIADAFLKYGKFRSIPLVLFLGDDGTVVGHFIERPDSVTELRAAKRKEIYERHPEFGGPEGYATLEPELRAALGELLLKMRDETRPFAIAEVARELGEIVERASSVEARG